MTAEIPDGIYYASYKFYAGPISKRELTQHLEHGTIPRYMNCQRLVQMLLGVNGVILRRQQMLNPQAYQAGPEKQIIPIHEVRTLDVLFFKRKHPATTGPAIHYPEELLAHPTVVLDPSAVKLIHISGVPSRPHHPEIVTLEKIRDAYQPVHAVRFFMPQ